MNAERFVRAVLIAGAAVNLVVGAWLMIDPKSFYDALAVFPPYNRHFLHDAGAFQLGLGAALALALTGWDGRRVALWAVAVASVFHVVSHAVDSELGGRDSDVYLLSLLALAFVAAGLLATRKPRSENPDAQREVNDHEAPAPPSGLSTGASQSPPQSR